MNYLKELKAFQNWLLLNDLNTSGIALWHTLMSINNMTGWKERFNAPNSTVEKLTGLSKQGLVNARKKLIENNLIEYEKGKRDQAPVYKMISMVNPSEIKEKQHSDSEKENSEPEKDHSEPEQQKPQNPHAIYQDNFGVENAMISDDINQWCDDLSEEMVSEAMKMTLEKNVHNFSYTKKILMNWYGRGFKSMDDVRAHEKKMEREKEGGMNAGNRRGHGETQGKGRIGEERSAGESVTGGQIGRINPTQRV